MQKYKYPLPSAFPHPPDSRFNNDLTDKTPRVLSWIVLFYMYTFIYIQIASDNYEDIQLINNTLCASLIDIILFDFYTSLIGTVQDIICFAMTIIMIVIRLKIK